MVFQVDIQIARREHPHYEFLSALTPSAQKAAFRVRKDGRDFCLKIIAPNQSLERVQREVLAMQSIEHPNVAKIVEYEYSARHGATRHFLIEEYIDGADLSQKFGSDKTWGIKEVKEIFVPLARGLEALANSGIVHRDLKPSNVRIRPSGEPVIIDFGLARMLDMDSLTPTVEGAMLGTPRYFSPEQIRGTKRDIDHRTDLYALGVMLFEATVGRHPSLSETPKTMDELDQAICDSKAFLSDERFIALPKKMQLLIGRLLEKERGRRPARAAMVAELLDSIEVE